MSFTDQTHYRTDGYRLLNLIPGLLPGILSSGVRRPLSPWPHRSSAHCRNNEWAALRRCGKSSAGFANRRGSTKPVKHPAPIFANFPGTTAQQS